MLLETYTLKIFKSKCRSMEKGVHCFAFLDQDVSDALPYLNSVLGGFEYITDPPSVTFKAHGKLITVHGKKIAVNALKNRIEAEKIIEWLKNEINSAWENKCRIAPSYSSMPKPKLIEILKLLPKTNCKKCNESTCMIFAIRVAEGAKGPEECPQIDAGKRQQLGRYMQQFNMDI